MIGYRHIKQGFIYEAVYGYEQYGPGETDIFDFEEYESPYIGLIMAYAEQHRAYVPLH